ncbi:MAG: tetratricopeptide repeat protein [Bacteroidia bacterium]|nr:tetratricopeptide repeat protein [Bacteroidia bacterium]NND52904.1 tetratricopeptide repeat protein [Flavobacteriaceae bacterium]
MKKHVIMGLALMMVTFTFAQKKELKEAEKAIKNNNFASAKTQLDAAAAMMSSMDDKTLAKMYFLKGKAFYANGTANDSDIAVALESFKKLREAEAKTGKKTYTAQADEMRTEMSNGFLTKAQSALDQKDHASSSINFERAYRTSTSDTLYLYNAALLATSSKNYDDAIRMYDELTELGYTGISMDYRATEIETGEEQSFPTSVLRDISVQAGTHDKSRNVKSESKVGEIAKNVALIYIEKGETDKGLAAIEKAKNTNPNDYNLILAEANVRYKLGEQDKYKELISEALKLEPNNPDLLFNLGVVAGDQGNIDEAQSYYDQAIAADATYTRAYMNSAAIILEKEQAIIDEMNALGTSAADDKKYEELQEDRLNVYREAIPYLKSAIEQEPDNINAVKTLMNIYSVLGDTPNYQAMKAKAEELGGEN